MGSKLFMPDSLLSKLRCALRELKPARERLGGVFDGFRHLD